MIKNIVYKNNMLHLFACFMALFIITLMLPLSFAVAEEAAGQKNFASPQQAVEALVAAVKDNDDTVLLAILGPESEDLIFSGDNVADQTGRSHFLAAYEEKNSLEQGTTGQAVLFVGNRDYPFPIPIVQQGDDWHFDTEAGKEEILNRRIGRNELHTIDVIQAYTDAQREYACLDLNGKGAEFAQKLTSSEGRKDGLYWKADEGEKESPFGPLIARATKEGYEGSLDQNPPEPFHGYYFKVLKKQGEHANGGAFDYVADDKMVLGFALLAYPAKYGASGIMSFIINQEGIIYEKDLGEDTAEAAATLTTFDPDSTWNRYKENAEQ